MEEKDIPINGWFAVQATPTDFHVVPYKDMKVHKSEDCWCNPECEYEENGNVVIIHNSMDQREKYETGERKLN